MKSQFPEDLLQAHDWLDWPCHITENCFPCMVRQEAEFLILIRGKNINKALSPRSPGVVQKKTFDFIHEQCSAAEILWLKMWKQNIISNSLPLVRGPQP